MSNRKAEYWALKGGLDVVSPAITMDPGMMIGCLNMTPSINGGYQRIDGYERYDGRPLPSASTWTHLGLTTALTALVPGDPYMASVISLLNFAGMADGTTFTDFIVGAPAFTAAGDAQVTSGELVLDGTGDWIAGAHDATFRDAFSGVTGTAWTIEYKMQVGQVVAAAVHLDYRDAVDTVGMLVSQEAADENKITVRLGDATSGWEVTLQSTDTFAATDVIEVAITRSGNDYLLHLDGVYQDTAASAVTLDLGDLGLRVGAARDGTLPATGDFRRMRFTSGVSRYAVSTNYTPEAGDSYYEVLAVGASVGDVISGQTSGATAEVVLVGDDLDAIYISKITGTFVNGELLDNDTIGLLGFATIGEVPAVEYAPTITEEENAGLGAENTYREDITQVPGLNAIRGIWEIADRVYAFRDNAGETACVCHKASASGWDDSLITMADYFTFNSGSTAPSIGDTMTGASSGATGVVHKVILHSGTWAGNDAAGYLVITSPSLNFSSGENVNNTTTASANDMTTTSVSSTFAFPVGGRYDFVAENFYASATSFRTYGANGVGPAFEIDENDIVSPILLDTTAGDSPDENKPHLIEAFDGALWLAFAGGSVQKSVTGSPLTWNGFLGAAEFGLGEEITGINRSGGDVMLVRTRRHTHGFYKDGSGGYLNKIISDRAGGILWTEQVIDTSYAVDDSGLTNINRVDTFGDFAGATISDLVQPLLIARRGDITASGIIRETNTYFVLFSNGEGISAKIMGGNSKPEFGLVSLGQALNVAYSTDNEAGAPTLWFGGDSGYVYRFGLAKNFDGEAIESFVRLPFAHRGMPAYRKRYRLADLELVGQRSITLRMSAELDYAEASDTDYSWSTTVTGGGGFYDLGNWDEVYWDAQTFNTARFELTGTGQNISLLIYHNSAVTAPFVLQGVTLHYDVRRIRR